MTPLSMIREDLDRIPRHTLPAGYALRFYRPGDEMDWVQIQTRADEYNEISLALFFREFGPDSRALADRMIFVIDDEGAAIGTATAWYHADHRGRSYGQVHWVAIVPEKQGQGLSKLLMTAVCERLRSLGPNRAFLITSPARVPAINLYLQFGFVPEICSDKDRDVWSALQARLRYPAQIGNWAPES